VHKIGFILTTFTKVNVLSKNGIHADKGTVIDLIKPVGNTNQRIGQHRPYNIKRLRWENLEIVSQSFKNPIVV
jgi:hypothetical protein